MIDLELIKRYLGYIDPRILLIIIFVIGISVVAVKIRNMVEGTGEKKEEVKDSLDLNLNLEVMSEEIQRIVEDHVKKEIEGKIGEISSAIEQIIYENFKRALDVYTQYITAQLTRISVFVNDINKAMLELILSISEGGGEEDKKLKKKMEMIHGRLEELAAVLQEGIATVEDVATSVAKASRFAVEIQSLEAWIRQAEAIIRRVRAQVEEVRTSVEDIERRKNALKESIYDEISNRLKDKIIAELLSGGVFNGIVERSRDAVLAKLAADGMLRLEEGGDGRG